MERAELKISDNIMDSLSPPPESPWYSCDFETTTDEKQHKAYLVCFMNIPNDASEVTLATEVECKYGENCGQKMLSYLTRKHSRLSGKVPIVLLFHNASYDARFLFHYINHGHPKLIENGSKVKSLEFTYECQRNFNSPRKIKRRFKILDSYSFINNRLSQFPKMFFPQESNNIRKEVLPYAVYTSDRFNAETTSSTHPLCGSSLTLVRLTVSDRMVKTRYRSNEWVNPTRYSRMSLRTTLKEVLTTAREWGCIQGNSFNMTLYALRYCEQDVRVLAKDGPPFALWFANLLEASIPTTRWYPLTKLATSI